MTLRCWTLPYQQKLGLEIAEDTRVLTKQDIIEIIRQFIQLINSKAEVDDIDHFI